MHGWQANLKRTCAPPVLLGLCPKMKNHPLCGWIFICIYRLFSAAASHRPTMQPHYNTNRQRKQSLCRNLFVCLYFIVENRMFAGGETPPLQFDYSNILMRINLIGAFLFNHLFNHLLNSLSRSSTMGLIVSSRQPSSKGERRLASFKRSRYPREPPARQRLR